MKNLTSTKTQMMMILAVLILSAKAIAAVPCPNAMFRNDNILNLKEFSSHLEGLYNELDESGENAKYDMRRKIDRQNLDLNDPMFALHAIGKVTAAKVTEGKPGFEKSTKAEENKSWGTGFMISPCHMITNQHVVCEKELVNGKYICKKNEVLNGKSSNFSFGENDNGTDFEKRVTGNIVASDESLDYAIVKIHSLKNTDEAIPYILPNFWNIAEINNSVSLGAGYPAQSLGVDSHKLHGMKAKMRTANSYVQGRMTFTPGNSGSPTLYLKNNLLTASGLFNKYSFDSHGEAVLNSSPRIVGLPAIGSDLKLKNRSVLDDVIKSFQTGQCN